MPSSRLGRARPVGLQPTDLIRGHPRAVWQKPLWLLVDARPKAGHERIDIGSERIPLLIKGNRFMPHSVEMITVAGASIRLFRGGTGEPLVFLHGAGGHTGWMAFLEALSERFTVFAPEHPG